MQIILIKVLSSRRAISGLLKVVGPPPYQSLKQFSGVSATSPFMTILSDVSRALLLFADL